MFNFDDEGVNPDLFDADIAAITNANGQTASTMLGIPICDTQSVLQLCLQFVINLLVCFVIVRYFYYPKSRRKDFAVTFVLFSTSVFLLLFFMKSVGIDVSIGLGLFMIFGIMRYRTEMVPIREMTYLFLTIATAVINGSNLMVSYVELLLANLMIISVLAVLECVVMRGRTATRLVCYERIELIRPERRKELIADLEERLGHKINGVDIGNVDLLRDVAFIKVHYTPGHNEQPMTEPTMKINEKNSFNA
jgi:hypothetical protein